MMVGQWQCNSEETMGLPEKLAMAGVINQTARSEGRNHWACPFLNLLQKPDAVP